MASFGNVTAALTGLRATIAAVGTEADKSREKLRKNTNEANRAATELDNVIFLLKQKVEQGDDLAKSLLDVIASVEDGTIKATDAATAYGALTSTLLGDTESIFALLNRVLPTVGEVQARLQALRQETLSVGQILARLADQNNTLAQSLAAMVQAYKRGELELSFLLEKAQAIGEALPGSETELLADKLREALETGGGL